MNPICRSCNGEIIGRYHSAKICFPCSNDENGRGQTKAIQAVKKAIKKGVLKHPSEHNCVDCGKPAQCYDHKDYGKPLEVEPVCRKCNYRRGSAIPASMQKVNV